jgi:hypothetical protein
MPDLSKGRVLNELIVTSSCGLHIVKIGKPFYEGARTSGQGS